MAKPKVNQVWTGSEDAVGYQVNRVHYLLQTQAVIHTDGTTDIDACTLVDVEQKAEQCITRHLLAPTLDTPETWCFAADAVRHILADSQLELMILREKRIRSAEHETPLDAHAVTAFFGPNSDGDLLVHYYTHHRILDCIDKTNFLVFLHAHYLGLQPPMIGALLNIPIDDCESLSDHQGEELRKRCESVTAWLQAHLSQAKTKTEPALTKQLREQTLDEAIQTACRKLKLQ